MQFTISRLLISTAAIAMGVAGGAMRWKLSKWHSELPWIVQVLLVAGVLSSAAFVLGGIGYLFRRPWTGIAAGYLLIVVYGLLAPALD